MAASNGDRAALEFLGGVGGVTGSKYLIRFAGRQLLLDCGLFQGLKELRLKNWAPFPIPASRLDAIVLTHAHLDHSGYLPRLVAQGFRGTVFATQATCSLLEIMLLDAAYLQEEEARYANKAGYSKHRPALPLYTSQDAERTLRLLRPTGAREEIQPFPGLSVRFSRVGHILGAAAVHVGYDLGSGKKVLVDSGDLGRYGRPILKDPEPVPMADWLMVESTYGNRLHPENPEGKLADLINEVADTAGCLIIPCFAVGRMQEIIYSIRKLEDEERIPILPVHVDSPMAINATEIYAEHVEEHNLDMRLLAAAETSPLSTRRFFIHRTQEESKSVNSFTDPFILLTSSGMITGGRVLHHLRERLPDPRTTVLFVGYQPEGTRGQQLQQGTPEVKMFGQRVAVRARIKTIDGFSAHADQAEIFRWLAGFKRAPRQVYIVHGEPRQANGLATLIREKLNWKVVIPKLGDSVLLK